MGRMRRFLRCDYLPCFNRLFSENATEFMNALAITAAQNCPLDFKSKLGRSHLRYALMKDDVDAAKILFQRGAVIETKALERPIRNLDPEMVKILLENGADVHAETDLGGRPMPIHELCAQKLQTFETMRKRKDWLQLLSCGEDER